MSTTGPRLGNPDSIRDGYDRWAKVYDHDRNPLPALEEPVVRALEPANLRGLRALDLGCGTGRHAIRLAERGAHVTAVDFSAGMIDAARGKPGAESVKFVVHDLTVTLPFDDQSFELVVSGLVLEHLGDLDRFFGEIRRVLRPSGVAIVSAMHPAMYLRGSQARFTDPDSGEVVEPGSHPHGIGDFVTAALGDGLRLTHLSEHTPDAEFAGRFPRCEKYVGWPMLVVFAFGV
ncbi:MAG: class I SAM-dependent methyltransferase [Gemmatimonadetes bacterium]|nr:class I SAM-dependent methyltransferase [Gemmatimonadota bacterium]